MSLPSQRRQAQGARRAGPQVQHATLAIPLPVQPTAGECAALLKGIIKHLLFQRAQIPNLYDQLLRAVAEQKRAEQEAEEEAAAAGGGGRQRRRRRVPKADKRLLKFLGQAEEVMAALDTALRTFGIPPRCFLLLGASTAKPREIYEVVLPPTAEGPPSAPAAGSPAAGAAPADEAAGAAVGVADAPQEQQAAAAAGGRPRLPRQERLCLLAVRQLVVAGAELPEGSAHTVPCKLFVLLEGGSSSNSSSSGVDAGSSAGGAEATEQHWQQQQLQQPQQQDAALPAAPPGFAVKRQFKLSMRKGVHLRLLLGQQHPEPAPVQAPEEEQPLQEALPGIQGSMDSSSSSGESQGEAEGEAEVLTVHLSQLPDAGSQPPPSPLNEQQPGGNAAAGAAAASAVGPAAAAAGGTAGSVWYLCRTVPKGLNRGSLDDGSTEGF